MYLHIQYYYCPFILSSSQVLTPWQHDNCKQTTINHCRNCGKVLQFNTFHCLKYMVVNGVKSKSEASASVTIMGVAVTVTRNIRTSIKIKNCHILNGNINFFNENFKIEKVDNCSVYIHYVWSDKAYLLPVHFGIYRQAYWQKSLKMDQRSWIHFRDFCLSNLSCIHKGTIDISVSRIKKHKYLPIIFWTLFRW